MPISTQKEALASQTTHSFRTGVGYVKHSAAPRDPGACDACLCDPPSNVHDGSFHILKVPGGGKGLVFSWVAKEKAWSRTGGKRMAFTAAYLSSHGWTYYGAV